MKRVRERKKVLSPSTENDYSDWYRRDVIEMEGKIKAKDGQLKQVESHFYDVLSTKKSPLYSCIYAIKWSMKKGRQASCTTRRF